MTDQEKLKELERRLVKCALSNQDTQNFHEKERDNRWNDDEKRDRAAAWAEQAKGEANLCREMLTIIWDVACPTCKTNGGILSQGYCHFIYEIEGELKGLFECGEKHKWTVTLEENPMALPTERRK